MSRRRTWLRTLLVGLHVPAGPCGSCGVLLEPGDRGLGDPTQQHPVVYCSLSCAARDILTARVPS